MEGSLLQTQHLIKDSQSNCECTQKDGKPQQIKDIKKTKNSINLYFSQKKELYDLVLAFIENEEQTNKIIEFLNNHKIFENQKELKLFLRLIKKIAENHHRSPNFNQKIKQIFFSLKDEIRQNFSNLEIFNLFNNDKIDSFISFRNEHYNN